MTITVSPARNEYTANAGQTIFNYTFKIFQNTDLNVYVTPAGQDANDSTDLTTLYTVTGVGDEDGGSITLAMPTNANDLVTIVSNIPSSRTTDYQNNGDFRPDVVNNDFDRVVSLVKKVEDRTNRGLLLPESQQDPKPLSLPIPKAGFPVRWNGDASGLENYDNSTASNEEIANDKVVINYPTLLAAQSDDGLKLNQSLNIKERTAGNSGGAMWDVVLSSSVTPNGFDIVQSISVPSLSLILRGSQVVANSKAYGVVADGVTDNIEAIRKMQVLNRFIQLPPGDVYVSEPVVLTVGQTINGLGISHTAIVTDGDYDAVQLGANADFTQVSNLSLRYTGGGQSLTSAAYRPEPVDGGNNHVLFNVSISNFKIAMGLGTKWWSSLAINVRCNNCGTDIKCFGLGQAINNTFINFYSNKPTERAIDIRAAKNWTFVTPNFGGNAANVFGSYMQIGTNSKGIKFINPNFEGEGTIAYPESQSGVEILSNSTVTFDNPTFTTNVGQGPGLSYEIEARDSSTVVVNYPEYISQGANMGRFKAIGSAKIVLTGGSQSDIDDSGSSVDSISVDERVRTGYRAEGVAAGVVAGDIIDTGLGETIKHVEANIIWSGDTRATVTVNVSDRFSNGTFKVRFTDIITGGAAAGTFDIYWFAK